MKNNKNMGNSSKHIPKVSIGMPVYNGEKYIREALDSLLAQTFTDLELIISDNASTDRTEAICREYAVKDSRIRYVRQPENRGGHWNFNYVLQAAKGLYFTYLACDDVLDSCFLEKTVNYMSRHNECVLVSGDFESIDKFGLRIRIEELDEIRETIKWEWRCREFFRYPISKVFFCIYGLMKTELAKVIFEAIPHPKMATGSELPLLARLAVAGQIVSIPMVLRKYRWHDMSMYATEVSVLKSKPALVRYFSYLANLYRLRFDQTRVLMGSDYPMSQKLAIVVWVYIRYFRSFLMKFVRLTGRLLRLNKKHISLIMHYKRRLLELDFWK